MTSELGADWNCPRGVEMKRKRSVKAGRPSWTVKTIASRDRLTVWCEEAVRTAASGLLRQRSVVAGILVPHVVSAELEGVFAEEDFDRPWYWCIRFWRSVEYPPRRLVQGVVRVKEESNMRRFADDRSPAQPRDDSLFCGIGACPRRTMIVTMKLVDQSDML